HSPGQRQFATPQKYREYYQGKYNLNDDQMEAFQEEQIKNSLRWAKPNRYAIAEHCRNLGIALASHDDATTAHVEESRVLGSVIAEFPTTEEAA
ncbi:alpha-D-ribose 1-methylphosphonate 5-triphosphate diphosphatase, partial [Salmonella enterica subsp. enterica]